MRSWSRARRSAVALLNALGLVVAFGCTSGGEDARGSEPSEIAVAEELITTFYSWDAATLAFLVGGADGASALAYYQKWAEAAHYAVAERRRCELGASGEVICAITVTDDFGRALGYTATDTFTISFDDTEIVGVRFEGDDPPIFEELFAWIAEERPSVLAEECKDMFAGGDTPGECASAVAAAAREYRALVADAEEQPGDQEGTEP